MEHIANPMVLTGAWDAQLLALSVEWLGFVEALSVIPLLLWV